MTKFLNNADVTGYISQTLVTSSLLKTDSSGKLVAAVAGTDYNAPNVSAVAGTLIREIRNTTGATLTKGTVVYISGATGNKPTVSKALATGDSTSAQTFGLCQTDIADNSNGYVVCVGDITGLDTSAFTEGVQLYLSSTTAGTYTTTKQVAPAHLVYVGVVTRSHPTQGQIEVKIQNGYELDEIHDVAISSKTNNDFLVYESATTLWKNKSLSTVLGYTPANPALYVPYTGATTNANLGVYSLSSSSVNVNGDTTNGGALNLKMYSGIVLGGTGYLSVYAQGNNLIGFYWGLSGGAKQAMFDNSLISTNSTRQYLLPNADGTLALTSDLSSYVPTSRTLTINGTAYDLSANRSWTIAPGTSARTETIFTATSGQTTFTISGGYTAGLVDVYVNGVKLLPADFTATNGSTVVLATGAVLNDAVTIINYTAMITALPTSRDVFDYTATAGQTAFTVSGGYAVGLLDVFVNGVKLTSSEYTATNGTSFTLAVASILSDQVQAIRYNASTTGISGSGTANYIPKFTASGTIGNSAITDDGTTVTLVSRALSGTSANFTGQLTLGSTITNGTYTYTLPGATGTLALTSALSSYLPLSGGTLTGALSGTSATFSGAIKVLTASNGSNQINFGTSATNYHTITYDDSTGKLTFNTDSSRIVSFLNSNVGIGTTSPTSLFHIASTTTLRSRLYTSSGASFMDIENAGNSFYIGVDDSTGSTFGGSAYARTFYGTAAYPMAFWTNATERMRITSSGNVGIGTTSPNANSRLHVYRAGGSYDTIVADGDVGTNTGYAIYEGGSPRYALYSNGAGGNDSFNIYNFGASSNSLTILTSGNVGIGTTSPGEKLWVNLATNVNFAVGGTTRTRLLGVNDANNNFCDLSVEGSNVLFYSAGAERMRITSGGAVLIGRTSVFSVFGDSLGIVQYGDGTIYCSAGGTEALGLARKYNDGAVALFRKDTTTVGSISVTGSATAYNTSSDYRLKQDLKSYNGLELVNQINTYDYEWKADNTRSFGVLAHELADILPYAVTGEKDGNDMQGVDYSKIVPVMVKAIQELKAELDTLKNA